MGSFVVFLKRVKKARRFHVNNEKTSSYKKRFSPTRNVANNKISVVFRYSQVEKSTGSFGEIINVGLKKNNTRIMCELSSPISVHQPQHEAHFHQPCKGS